MDAIELLKEFAKLHGIDKKEVTKFVKKLGKAKTLEELLEVPHDLLNHIDYITWVEEPLKSFLTDDMYCERRETITLETVIDILEDRRNYLDAESKDYEERLKYYEDIEKYLIDTKFGSVVYDW